MVKPSFLGDILQDTVWLAVKKWKEVYIEYHCGLHLGTVDIFVDLLFIGS